MDSKASTDPAIPGYSTKTGHERQRDIIDHDHRNNKQRVTLNVCNRRTLASNDTNRAPLFFPCAAKVEQVKFDATSMHARPDLAAQHKMVDDGTGETEVRETHSKKIKSNRL